MVEATTIIHWVNNHSIARMLLHDSQKHNPGNKRPLKLLTSVVTRWTSTYHSCAQLENLGPYLESLTFGYMKDRFIEAAGNTIAEQEKVNEIITLIRNNGFWIALEENNKHLRPLVIANMILQHDTRCLDHVCLMFGYLYKYFNNIPETGSRMAVVCIFTCYLFSLYLLASFK